MARPITYQHQDVLKAARNVFWQKGYADTSISDLEKATGLVRTSLYAAYGSKSQLFLATLKDYIASGQEHLNALKIVSRYPLKDLRNFIASLIKAGVNNSNGLGCFAICAGSDRYHACSKTKSLIDQNRSVYISLYDQKIRHAQNIGQLNKKLNSIKLANYLYVLQTGLMSSLRSGVSIEELENSLNLGLQIISDYTSSVS